jgi:pimeloyl-ACP methyl ester carboxylesterase
MHETAPTQFVQVGDVRVAYRRFGKRGAFPLLLLNYFAANMDDWDPTVTNGFAAASDVIIFDYPGIGRSTGATPSTVAAMTADFVSFCRALGLDSFDIVGFSLGGMLAQQLAFEYPNMVRRIILLGTGPRGGEGMTFTELSVDELQDPAKLLMYAFFTPSNASQAAGRAYLERLKLRTTDHDDPVSRQAAIAQLESIREWGRNPVREPLCHVGPDSPANAGRPWKQGRRRHADQCVSLGRAPPRCSADHVPGRQPRGAVATRRGLS